MFDSKEQTHQGVLKSLRGQDYEPHTSPLCAVP
jgi:hypothetical protein